ncbi:MAG: hypothetical protein Fur0023_09570 [Bacteroidia bacterium]
MLKEFAHLLKYPDENISHCAFQLIQDINKSFDQSEDSEISEHLNVFYDYLKKTTLKEQEEVYTQTFEVQSITTLDTGYILFGDDYKRAELLVNLNGEMTKHHIPTGTELSDYLPNILALLDAIQDFNLKEDLINHFVYPAVNKMILDFDAKIIEKKNEIYLKHQKALIEKSKEYKDIYVHVLFALKIFLERKYNAHEVKVESHSNGFLSSIEQEMNIEKLK